MNFTITNPDFCSLMYDKVITAKRRNFLSSLSRNNSALANLLKDVDSDGLRMIFNYYSECHQYESMKRLAQIFIVRYGMEMNEDDYQLWSRRASD